VPQVPGALDQGGAGVGAGLVYRGPQELLELLLQNAEIFPVNLEKLNRVDVQCPTHAPCRG
jgi:hypothetical protein